MNNLTKNLLDLVNNKLIEKPLIYFSREVERSIGLENLLNNYYIACIEEHYIVDQLLNKDSSKVFCLSKYYSIESKSTHDLINNPLTNEWVDNIIKNKPYYSQMFQFNAPTFQKINKSGGKVLNNANHLNRQFEGKINQYKMLKDNNITIPDGFIIESNNITYQEIIKKLGSNFVLQLDRSTTGGGTFFITSEEEWNLFLRNYLGNVIKVTKLIIGETYTINGCITKKGIFISGLQYQLTGYSELTSAKGSTVGNDWSYANQLSSILKNKIYTETKKIGEIMSKEGFKGLFGIDLVVEDEKIYIIEINARQTANIPMQTKLELVANLTPLSLFHIAEFMNIEISEDPPKEIIELEGAQVFLRSKVDNFKVQNNLRSGIHKLSKDKDISLSWEREGYSINDLRGEEVIFLAQKKGVIKNVNEELSRIQFKNKIINNGKITPWILKTMTEIEKILK